MKTVYIHTYMHENSYTEKMGEGGKEGERGKKRGENTMEHISYKIIVF